jgi:hypothetical protein
MASIPSLTISKSQAQQDILHRIGVIILTAQLLQIMIFQGHLDLVLRIGIYVHDLRGDLAAGQLFDQQGGPFEGIYRTGNIHSLLEMRSGIGPQVHAGTKSYGYRWD